LPSARIGPSRPPQRPDAPNSWYRRIGLTMIALTAAAVHRDDHAVGDEQAALLEPGLPARLALLGLADQVARVAALK
jgi:hypothetical protein